MTHRLGVAQRDSTGAWCAAFPAAEPRERIIDVGDEVTLVWTDSTLPRASVTGRVRAVRTGACYRAGLDTAASNALAGEGALAYDVSLADSTIGAVAPGVAHAVPGRSVWRATNERAYGDLDGDGIDEFVRVCTSSEGLHFTLWKQPSGGAPQRTGHLYYYLGYDVEPSCTEEEYRG